MSFPFQSMQYGYNSTNLLRPGKLKSVTLTHLSHGSGNRNTSTAAADEGGNQQPVAKTHSGSDWHNWSHSSDPFLVAAPPPSFSPVPLLPSTSHTSAQHAAHGDGDDRNRHPRTHAGVAARSVPLPSDQGTGVSNLAKWSAFGLDTTRYGGHPRSQRPQPSSLSPQQQQQQQQPRNDSRPAKRTNGKSEGYEVDDGEVLFCGSCSSLSSSQVCLSNASVSANAGGLAARGKEKGVDLHEDAAESLPLPRKPLSSSAMSTSQQPPQGSEPVASSSLALLRRHLSELSYRVNEAAERERCGPPKPGGGGKGGASGVGSRWKYSNKGKKREGAVDGGNDDDGDDDATAGRPTRGWTGGEREEGEAEGEATEENGASSRCAATAAVAAAAAVAVASGKKRGRGADSTGDLPTNKKKPPAKRAKKAPGKKGTNAKAAAEKQWQSLFPLHSGVGPQAYPQQQPGAISGREGGGQGNALAGGAHDSFVAVAFVRADTHAAQAALFNDMETSLNDPDRIQAPSLFLGVLYENGETNFSLSSRSHGKALLPSLSPCATGGGCSDDENAKSDPGFLHGSSRCSNLGGARVAHPREAHRHCTDVVLRWRDKVYVMAATQQHLSGFSFVLRVLRELVGVEVITFNAPAVLLPLLSSAAGDLVTHCVSDARLMAWMASLSDPASTNVNSSSSGKNELVISKSGNEQCSELAPVYDYVRLLEQYGGKSSAAVLSAMPYPADLSRKGESGVTWSLSQQSSLHAAALQRLVNETYHLAPLYRALYGVLGAKGLLQAFLRQEKRIPLLLASMKREGIRVHLREVQRFKTHCVEEMQRWRAKAGAFVPQMPDFNIQSPDQVRIALYEVLQLGKHLVPGHGGSGQDGQEDHDGDGHSSSAGNLVVITKGGKLSTAEETLRILARHHAFPHCIMQYRKVAKVLQTYVEGMMSFAIPCGSSALHAGENGVRCAGATVEDGRRKTAEEKEDGGDVPEDGDSTFRDVALIHINPQSEEKEKSEVEDNAKGQGSDDDEEDEEDGKELSKAPVSSASPKDSEGTLLALSQAEYATLHPNFLQEGTDTGRLSCVEPNLQNLPRTAMQSTKNSIRNNSSKESEHSNGKYEDEEEEDKEELLFRKCFVAPPGWVLLSVDYQQIELRVLAHLCADAALVQALSEGNIDLHRTIAEIVFKKKPVTAEERNLSKRVVFGVLYGAGPRTLAGQMGVSVERALYVSSLLRSAFPQINSYHQKVIQQGREDGYVRTISGRVRHLPDMSCPVMGKRAYAERQAFNTVVQGSAADVMKMAMLAVERDVLRPLRDDVQLLMQIHDEMIFAVRKEKLALVLPLVTKAMSRAMSLLVPLNVTAKFGPSLGEFQEWTVDHELGLL